MSVINHAKSVRSTLWKSCHLFFLAILSSIVTIWAQSRGGAVATLEKLPFIERVLNAIVYYIVYLTKTFWPVHLAVFYPYEPSLPLWQVLGAASILLGISIAVIMPLKKHLFFLSVGSGISELSSR